MTTSEHYAALFSELESRVGKVSDHTLTSIVGFGAGGLVSICEIPGKNAYVSCELSLYRQQVPSAEGLRFELLSVGSFTEEDCRRIFTAVGALSFESQLGHGHTAEVSVAFGGGAEVLVQLNLFSQTQTMDGRFGIYEVLPIRRADHDAA